MKLSFDLEKYNTPSSIMGNECLTIWVINTFHFLSIFHNKSPLLNCYVKAFMLK